jgi:hypothetical protein
MIHDAAVVIPTVLRPGLLRAVRSVYEQDHAGSVQVMVGVDVNKGDAAILDALRAECPKNRTLTVLDLGYSTNSFNGGFYPIRCGGALKTILSYAANARYIAYLDDDNWYAPSHLSDLLRAVKDKAWAFSYRWFVDPDTQQPLAIDRWESVGPDRGIYATKFNYHGLVDTNTYLLDKLRCHNVLPFWCVPHRHSAKTEQNDGTEDRSVFDVLRTKFKFACTERATVYYSMTKDSAPYRSIQYFQEANILGDPATPPPRWPEPIAPLPRRPTTKKKP